MGVEEKGACIYKGQGFSPVTVLYSSYSFMGRTDIFEDNRPITSSFLRFYFIRFLFYFHRSVKHFRRRKKLLLEVEKLIHQFFFFKVLVLNNIIHNYRLSSGLTRKIHSHQVNSLTKQSRLIFLFKWYYYVFIFQYYPVRFVN